MLIGFLPFCLSLSHSPPPRCSLAQYGEVLPSGVTTLLSSQNLAANRARKLVDIGSGCGKLALQAFVEFPNLESVVGVEICQSRTQVGINALRHLSKTQPLLFQLISADVSSHPPEHQHV